MDFRIILQQRVASNDICQYLLDSNPQKYLHVCLPVKVSASINPPELIEIYENGLLWKNRFTEKVILDFQQTLGSRAFAGQLMQKPTAEEGNLIKRKWIQSITLDNFNKLTGNQKSIEWNLYVDTAYTAKQENDSTAVLLACRFNSNVYIKKAWKYWLEFPEMSKQLQTTIKEYGVRMTYIESKASGLSIKQYLQRNGFNVADLTPRRSTAQNMWKDADKISRVNSITPKIEGGHLWIIEDNWNEMVLQELANFPFGHDDIVDTVVYSIDNLLGATELNYAMI